MPPLSVIELQCKRASIHRLSKVAEAIDKIVITELNYCISFFNEMSQYTVCPVYCLSCLSFVLSTVCPYIPFVPYTVCPSTVCPYTVCPYTVCPYIICPSTELFLL